MMFEWKNMKYFYFGGTMPQLYQNKNGSHVRNIIVCCSLNVHWWSLREEINWSPAWVIAWRPVQRDFRDYCLRVLGKCLWWVLVLVFGLGYFVADWLLAANRLATLYAKSLEDEITSFCFQVSREFRAYQKEVWSGAFFLALGHSFSVGALPIFLIQS